MTWETVIPAERRKRVSSDYRAELGCGVVIDYLSTEPCGCGRVVVDTLRRSGGELVEAVPLADIGVVGGWGKTRPAGLRPAFRPVFP